MINFITPLYRYNNIEILYNIISSQTKNFKWYLISGSSSLGCSNIDFLSVDNRIFKYHIDGDSIWGHEKRNFFIENVICSDNEWCYFLDDDNIVTSDLIYEAELEYESDYDVILFSQKQGMTDKNRLLGRNGHMSLGLCDIGSFLIRYGKIKATKIYNENQRNADGHYCEQISKIPNIKIKYSEDKFVRYNALSNVVL